MQTFLPIPDFCMSAAVLDSKRLGKQRVETKQILLALGIDIGEHKGNPNSSWSHHPCVKMWKGYEPALITYGLECCDAWIKRGFKDTLYQQFELALYLSMKTHDTDIIPSFVFNNDFNRSHQSNLIRKNPYFYSRLFPNVPSNLPYLWPQQMEDGTWQYSLGVQREITLDTENYRPAK